MQKALISEYGMDERRILELAGQYAVQSTINDTGWVLADAFVGSNATSEMSADVRSRIRRLVLHGAYVEADRAFMEAIRDMGTFGRWKADAERMGAFNSAVAYLAATAPSYRRFLELRELHSYKSGVFLKDDLRDVDPGLFVSFTVGFKHAMFKKRRGTVDFPAEPMRNQMVPVRYSPFYRINDMNTERIFDEKGVRFTNEVEVRIRINSRVPKNLKIMIKNISGGRANSMEKEYGDLGSIKFG